MSARIAIIVGLGNPGPQYERTRHNAGFWFTDVLARQFGGHFRSENRYSAEACKVRIAGDEVWLLKPMTFMNRSGQSLSALARFFKIAPESILVAHDELDLEPGTVRLKTGGGHGGHNGLRDIVAQLGGNTFHRLRIGIGHPGHSSQVSNYVLSKASPDDQIAMDRAIDNALEVIESVVSGEMQKAMNRLHSSQ